jgi:hypothetical protein
MKMESGTNFTRLDEDNFDVVDGDTSNAPHKTQDEPIIAGLVHAPASPEGFATCVTNLQAEYRALNSTIQDLTTELLAEHSRFVDKVETVLIPMLDRMQKVLSKRGELHAVVICGEITAPEVADLDALPTWTEWYETFRERVNLSLSLRTVQRKLAKLRGKTADDSTAAEHDEAEPIDEASDGQSERVEIKTGPELLAEYAANLLEALTGKSINSDAMRVTRATEMAKDLQRALDEGKLLDPVPSVATALLPQQPPIIGDPVTEPDPGTLEELRQRLSRLADTYEMNSVLGDFVRRLVNPLLEHHAHKPTFGVSISVSRDKRPRIADGDWVEYRGGNERLSKQGVKDRCLGCVVGEDKLKRPRIRWYDDQQWRKPYSLVEDYFQSHTLDSGVHVLFDYQAAERYPEAFGSYLAEGEGKKVADDRGSSISAAVCRKLPESAICSPGDEHGAAEAQAG